MPDWTALLKLSKDASARDADCPTGKCPKKDPAIFAMVARADTGAVLQGFKVDVGAPTKLQKSTDGDGLAKFDPVKAGAQVVSLILTQQQAEEYVWPKSESVTASKGSTAQKLFLLAPYRALKVKLLDKNGDAPKSGVKVTAGKKEKTTGGDGVADFGPMKPGAYHINVNLPTPTDWRVESAEDVGAYGAALGPRLASVLECNIQVDAARDKLLTLRVERCIWITFQIKVEEGDLPVEGAIVHAKLPDDSVVQSPTDREGLVQFLSPQEGTVSVEKIELPDAARLVFE